MKQLTLPVSKAREMDRLATEDFGLPSFLLMENAGRELAKVILSTLERLPKYSHVLFFCGSGNNAGDGFAAARHLKKRHENIRIYLMGDPGRLSGDALLNYKIAKKFDLSIFRLSDFEEHLKTEFSGQPLIIVDAMIGTGCTGPAKEPALGAIKTINHVKKFHNSKVTIISADIPSGLSGDQGPIGGEAVTANVTVTFGCLKPGLVVEASKPYVGKLELADIGIPDKLLQEFE